MCLIYRKDAEPFAAVGRGFTLVELLLVIVTQLSHLNNR